MKALYCDEHGKVARVGEVRSTIPTVTFAMFCPICNRELFPSDPLTAIERQGQPAATFDEWIARDDMPVLDLGVVRANEEDGA